MQDRVPGADGHLANQKVDELERSIRELEELRSIETLAMQAELDRRDRDTAGLRHLLNQARSDGESLRAQLAAVESSKVLRYTERLRRAYGKLRARGGESPAGAPVALQIVPPTPSMPELGYAEWAARYDTLTDEDRDRIRMRGSQIEDPPLVSVILPVFNTPEPILREGIESVQKQLYPHWELLIADNCSTDPRIAKGVADYAASESRIRLVRRDVEATTAAVLNSGLAKAAGRWVVFMGPGDRLREHALALAAVEADLYPETVLVYSDEVVFDVEGRSEQSHFKPDFDPLLLLAMNHIGQVAMFRRDLVAEVGGLREGFGGSVDWDLLFRSTEQIDRARVRHIPHILYERRSHPIATEPSMGMSQTEDDAGLRVVTEHLVARGEQASVTTVPGLGWNRVRWRIPEPPPMVTIVVPTRDGKWFERCLRSVWNLTSYGNYEILVVDNGSESKSTLDYLRHNGDRLRVLQYDQPFNYAKLNNAAVAQANGTLICLLNDDTEVISRDWLDEMVGQLLQPSVGVVGAKLYYDNGTIQHAGVVLGIGGIGGHVHRHWDRLDIGYLGRAECAQHYSAVTGACMLVRKEAWDSVGGLDAEHLAIAYNDVDLCLRMAESGWRTVWTPFAELIHHESTTRGSDELGANAGRLAAEGRYMQQRWGMLLRSDPAYNPNLTLVYEDFGLAYPPRAPLLRDELMTER